MPTDKNEPNIKNDPAETQHETGGNINPEDHPGLKKMSENPNPRANENIPDSDEGDRTDEVGSEITDGEDG